MKLAKKNVALEVMKKSFMNVMKKRVMEAMKVAKKKVAMEVMKKKVALARWGHGGLGKTDTYQ